VDVRVSQFDPVHSSLHTHVSGPMQVPPPFSLLQPPLQGAVHTHIIIPALVPRPPLCFVFLFAVSIIHESRRVGRPGNTYHV